MRTLISEYKKIEPAKCNCAGDDPASFLQYSSYLKFIDKKKAIGDLSTSRTTTYRRDVIDQPKKTSDTSRQNPELSSTTHFPLLRIVIKPNINSEHEHRSLR